MKLTSNVVSTLLSKNNKVVCTKVGILFVYSQNKKDFKLTKKFSLIKRYWLSWSNNSWYPLKL